MGAYIQLPVSTHKAPQLVEHYHATRIPEPERFEDIPPDQSLVCVIENVFFDAAAVMFDAEEFRDFKYDPSGRPRTWLLLDKITARTLLPRMYAELVV